jgi:hypothetical protein
VTPQPAAFEQMLTLMAGMEDDDEIDAMLTQVFQRANISPFALSANVPSCGSRVAAGWRLRAMLMPLPEA